MITVGEVDGIPAVAATDGPQGAGIVFRVGYADELLSRSGITHLVEHLALFPLGVPDYHYNGTTEASITSFYTVGSPEVAQTFLARVCTALRSLPFERLATEKRILQTEADGRGTSVADRLVAWRHGACGPGLAGYPEWGLNALAPFDLDAWVARYFTRDNAALWFSGMELPTGLRLDLPSGRRQPVAASVDVLPSLPACFPALPQHLGYLSVVPRSTPARLFPILLQRELMRRLRQDAGYSYGVTSDYHVVDAEKVRIFAVADIGQGHHDEAVGEFVDVLARFRWGAVEQSELDEVIELVRSAQTAPQAEAGMLPSAARDLLFGARVAPVDQLVAELAAVTVADIRNLAAQASANALLLTPQGTCADWAGFSIAPSWSVKAVTGQPVVALNDPDHSLVLGPDGISLNAPGGVGTVTFADCQAMLAFPDGGRVLIGSDGISCAIEPTLYSLPGGVIAGLDQRVPPDLVVPMPARQADAIPRPPQAAAPTVAPLASAPAPVRRAAPSSPPARRWPTITGIWLLGALLAILLLFAVAFTTMIGSEGEPAGDAVVEAVFAGIVWVLVGLCGWGIVRLALRLRGYRAPRRVGSDDGASLR